MTLIFLGSTDVGSMHHTSRFLRPLLHWLIPSLTDQQFYKIQYFIRKCGHVTEYSILSILIWSAKRNTSPPELRDNFWHHAKFAILLSAFYAGTDEFHQAFVPSRESSVIDVAIDTTGATISLTLLWLIGRWRKWWR